MKITKNVILAILIFGVISSCKTEGIILPMSGSSHVGAINKLPPDQKITNDEIIYWYNAMLKTSAMKPLWGRCKQTIFNGCHVIEVPTAADGALFFTKKNGILTVEAYRWQDKKPGIRPFTGNVIIYSFSQNKLTGTVYKQGIIYKTGSLAIPAYVSLSEFFDQIMVGDFWSQIGLGQTKKS